MGLNDTPSANRVHIGFFGRRNAGKSSVVNAVTGQETAVVSEVLGTTTDPVTKAMELLPIGPVVITDTPGIDDEGYLGEMRVARTQRVLSKTDIAVLVIDGTVGITEIDKELISEFDKKDIPYIIAYNKSDLADNKVNLSENEIRISAKTGSGIFELKEKIASIAQNSQADKKLVGDLINAGDFIVLVVPIDEAAPKGRLILPQQMAIRDILDADAVPIVTKETALRDTLLGLSKKPYAVITDSQVFKRVAEDTPEDIFLTSFSILMARYKGALEYAVDGVIEIENLEENDTILISEGCTHHRQCGDIGTVKLPGLLKAYTGKNFNIETSSGADFPDDLSKYSLIIHCGGCMLNEREMRYRVNCAKDAGVPITNYGTAIAYMNGILKRSLEILPNLAEKL